MVYIIGAGVAGLSLARALGRAGVAWCILEKEAEIGLYASGKNAGIIRSYETDPVIRHYAELTLAAYRQDEPGYDECGLIIKPWEIDYNLAGTPQRRFSHGRDSGFYLAQNGCVSAQGVLARLLREASAFGQVRFGFETQLNLHDGHLVSLQGATPSEIIALAPADQVVVANGEGAIQHAAALGRSLGLIAHRRNLYEYANVAGYAGPVEWNEETSCYFRADGDKLVATAGEQIPQASGQDTEPSGVNPSHLAALSREYPLLAERHLTGWRTCLRVMPGDNRPYCGADAFLNNLWWFAGLGGRGMSLAPALAEELARQLTSKSGADAYSSALAPARAEVI